MTNVVMRKWKQRIKSKCNKTMNRNKKKAEMKQINRKKTNKKTKREKTKKDYHQLRRLFSPLTLR